MTAAATGHCQSGRGRGWRKTEVPDYGPNRSRVIAVLDYLAALRQNASLSHWHRDAQAAEILAGALRNREDNV